MVTTYKTPDGYTLEPLEIDVWSFEGQKLAPLTLRDSAEFVWGDREPDTCDIVAPLSPAMSHLLPCDGRALIVARYGDKAHITTPVSVQASGDADTPGHASIRVSGAGGFGLLNHMNIPPTLDAPLTEQTTTKYEISGPLESVIKRLINQGLARVKLPLVVMPDQRRGPSVEAVGEWDTVGDVVKELLTGTQFRVKFTAWIPGMPQVVGIGWLSTPCYIVDVEQYSSTRDIRWSVVSGDIQKWTTTQTRATVTRATVGYETDKPDLRRYAQVQGVESNSPWSIREGYVKHSTQSSSGQQDEQIDVYRLDENMRTTGLDYVSKNAPKIDMDIDVNVSQLWEFSASTMRPRTFDVGEYVDAELPIGEYQKVITRVAVKMDTNKLTITPTLSNPDTLDTGIFAHIADIGRRVNRLEKET